MKKLLCSAAALTLMGGAAVAEVSVGGNARMGVIYTQDFDSTTNYGDSAWNFSSRIRITFTASGETDGGLQFGGSIRADNAGSGAKGAAGEVWISGEWGKISMGDVVGAAEAALFDLPEIGFQDLSSNWVTPGWGTTDNDVFYLTGDSSGVTGTDNPVLLYQYSAGDFNAFLSFSDGRAAQSADEDTQEYAIGANYTFGDYSVGFGYEVKDYAVSGVKNDEHWIIGGTGNFGDTSVNVFYGALKDGTADETYAHYGIGVSSQFDAITVMAYVQSFEDQGRNSNGNTSDFTHWGLGASYDLGGGASVVGGISGNNDHYWNGTEFKSTDIAADVGVKFKF